MATDPRNLKPGELCRLLNSTPLGEVLTESQFRRQRTKAGHRIGAGAKIDLLRYTAWLVGQRHGTRNSKSDPDAEASALRNEMARQAASAVSIQAGSNSAKWERILAALLSEPSHARAAEKAGIGETTLYRWLKDPAFRKAYERARKELVAAAVAKLQTSTGEAIEALSTVARKGRRDGDRVRAASALLDHAWKGMLQADLLQEPPTPADGPTSTAEVVTVLARRLRALEQSTLPASEKARLTVSVGDGLLRALGVDVLEKRLAALEGVLDQRKGKR